MLYSDTIKYEITAVNANLQTSRVVITDTLPPYMEYVEDSDDVIGGSAAAKGDNIWAHACTLYVHTKKGVTVRVYTPDGILRDAFITTANAATTVTAGDRGLTTRRLPAPDVYIVTLDGGPGWEVAVRM